MPFDSMTMIDRPVRLVALDPTLRTFGPSVEGPGSAGFRPIPAWHPVRDPNRIGLAIGILARARELIADDERWCRRSFARGWAGIPVPAKSAVAQRFCALGAVMRAAHELGAAGEDACNALEWQTRRPVQDWNDDPARRHAEVLALFDAAIAGLEAA
jgi:hypothetical protein